MVRRAPGLALQLAWTATVTQAPPESMTANTYTTTIGTRIPTTG
jgi:hypothetical protein